MTTEAQATVSTRARHKAVLVTGAGRSGTSVLTRGIAALGVELGDRLRPPGGKNPTGFFEDLDFLSLSKRLVRELGLNAGSIRLSEPADWETSAVQALQAEAVALIRRRFAEAPVWGFKYSRSLRLLPFWERVFDELDMELCCVVALRNPLSVARSRGQINPQRGRPVWNSLEWLTSMAPYMHRLRDKRFTVVDFDRLIADPAEQLRRVANVLQLELGADENRAITGFAEAFLKPDMRNSQFSAAELEARPEIYRLVRRTYIWLMRLAHDEAAVQDDGVWREWDSIRSDLTDLAPVLAELETMRALLNRALWNPVSPTQALAQVWRNWKSR